MINTARPSSVSFRRLTDDDVLAMSVRQVKTADDLRDDCFGGVQVCGTCGVPSCACDGHFGHIVLPVPVSHPMFPGKTMSVLPVPPTRVRLPNRGFDAPLTALLRQVLRCIDRYHRCVSSGKEGIESVIRGLSLAVTAYFTSTDSRQGLSQRLRGKSGVLRQTLMGWRVNSCARAVIAPDPLLAPWEVGVPGPLASVLGLCEGDSVVLNRQPSLHRGSMMGHVVRLRPNDFCLSISPTVTPPYNADFDGDEMNLHKTDVQSQADARFLIGVENLLLSSSCGMPQVRLVQDACLATYLAYGRNSKAQSRDLIAVCEKKSQSEAAKLLHEQQKLAYSYLQSNGFSVGVDDFIKKVPWRHAGRSTLGSVAVTVFDHVPKTNRIRQMVEAGSKGSAINLVQLFACVGYQSVAGVGAQTPPGKPEMHSFVGHSFVEGLTEEEFWLHACASREGMIQTAVKTADAGYLMRRMVKTLENVTVAYDGTVRDSCGSVVQFVYGTDGQDATTSQFQTPQRVEPGEPVGILCAQAVGHKLTQLTLDTFHKAGIAFRHGLARVRALLDATAQHVVVKGLYKPYMHVRVPVSELLGPWKACSQLPKPALLECQLRQLKHTGSWVCAQLLSNNCGLQAWQVAARLRTQGVQCVSDSLQVYSTAEVLQSCETGSLWAASELVDGYGVFVKSHPPDVLDRHAYLSEPTLVAQQLGIEAARAVLISEMSSYMSGVDNRHLDLLADAMTYTGDVLGTTRAGMANRDEASIMGRACFETAPQVLSHAACRGSVDPLRSASSRLSVGCVPRIGAHAFDVVKPIHNDKRRCNPHHAPSVMDMPAAKRFCFSQYL